MSEVQRIELNDVESLIASHSPDAMDTLLAFLNQPEPQAQTPLPQGAITTAVLLTKLRAARTKNEAKKRREASTQAWKELWAQKNVPRAPRFGLADLLVRIYEQGGTQNRSFLIELIKKVPLLLGVWGGLKRIYKLAQANYDAEIFGVLSWKLDSAFPQDVGEISIGTLHYMRRRSWRFLRQLGHNLPELYPQFVVQVLRHYTLKERFNHSWIANHVWWHTKKEAYSATVFTTGQLPKDMTQYRAFNDIWKRDPEGADALMNLLEICENNAVSRFSIESLRKDFPQKLRTVTPEWLARLAFRPLESAHDFLIDTLLGSPEFHQSKLKTLGLHDAVLELVLSPSSKARSYAIEYARAQAQDLDASRLVGWLGHELAQKDTREFAAQMLMAKPPRELGHALLGRLLQYKETRDWAKRALNETFQPKELPDDFIIDMLFSKEGHDWSKEFLKKRHKTEAISISFWQSILSDTRAKDSNYDAPAVRFALEQLKEYSVATLGVNWLLDTLLLHPNMTRSIGEWLTKANALPNLDIERVKGLVFNTDYRAIALELLGNPKLVSFAQLELSWLLALAKRTDPTLHLFAHQYLLQHVHPEDFSDRRDREAGIDRLFAMAVGDKQAEPIRSFAQTYLRCHHPVLGAEQSESKQFDLKPQLTREAFSAERIWPALFDDRDDVRKFAIAITRVELRQWGYQNRIYELAESEAKEVRNVAFDALLKIGEASADASFVLKAEELNGAEVFALTESTRKATRELGVELIRRHYKRIGGIERLGWLMNSANREVRVFAIRLLWEKHRPRTLPATWKPAIPHPNFAYDPEDTAFPDAVALRDFLRRILFGIPPGRSLEISDADPLRRRVSAGVSKRQLIEIVRDFALEEQAFAYVIAPVLMEFTSSIAQGEWQACLAALMHLQNVYPNLSIESMTEPAATYATTIESRPPLTI